MSLTTLPASELHSKLTRGEVSAVDVTRACLDAITERDSAVAAFLHVDRDGALKQAEAIDRKRASGTVGRLAGLPIALKDNLCETGTPCTCASRMLKNFVPPYDAHVVERLKGEDAVLIGRVNLDEFAMGSSCENSAFQKTTNPWNAAHSPGGSSGGSAAAVAAGMAPLSLGSDTGGSIRLPASFCGVVGMKPTYGRVSRYGLVAFGSSLDQIGPMATDVRGAALALQAIAGHDRRDSTSVDRPVPDYLATLDQPLAGLKIGIVPEHFGAGLAPEVDAAIHGVIDTYRGLGAAVREIELPHTKYCVAVYYIVSSSEASSNLARYDGVHYGHRTGKPANLVDLYESSRAEGFGDEVKRRIMLGTYALSSGYVDAYYNKALKVRRLISDDFSKAFADVDVILSPVSPTPAFKLGELTEDPLAMYLMDIYTISANLAGLPGISIPCGRSSAGLPIGVQLLAPVFEEERLLRAARMYESTQPWFGIAPAG